MRKVVNLNFGWKYSPAFDDEMLKKGYDDGSFEVVDIPHANKELPLNYFDERDYMFVSCYRKRFRLDKEDYEGKRVLLHFEGVACRSLVYVNGKYAGEYKGAYTPFSFDITELLAARDNIIAVRVDAKETPDMPPFGKVVDYLCYGGIYREVWLECVDKKHIEDVFVRTSDILAEKKLLTADITFSESMSDTLKLELLDGEKVIAEKTCDFEAKVLRVKWRIGDVENWDINNPKLYTLRATLGEDVKEVRFGFREAKFTKNGFYLNGKHIKLMGLNRHQSYPYVGYAMPKSAQEADADLLKFKLGCNIVRTSHYPDSIHFLNRCDEIGLLVFTEMPGWQYTDQNEGEWQDNVLENVRRMIIRDRNHPCVVLWGVRINEGPDCDPLYEKTNRLAHELDPTRQTGGVRNFPQSHLLEDVYTYNDFSHSGGAVKLLPPTVVAGPNAPYLVTEFNGHMYPTKSFDREDIRIEHALRHARVQSASFSNNRISGAIGWCMADYNTHCDFGSGDRICYHGVTDIFRVPKLAAAVYASQQDYVPVLEVSSTMDIGDHPKGMRGQVYLFTNCDYVKVYKNGKLTDTVYPNKKLFPNLPHPPMTPSDFIGDALENDPNLDKTVAKLFKDVLVAAEGKGFSVPPINYVKLLAGMIKGKMTISDTIDLITQYFANWGNEQPEYKFEGYIKDKLVATVVKSPSNECIISAKADKNLLIEDETYDVTRIELVATDKNNNRLNFAMNAVNVSVEGAARIIGPSEFSLLGGARAFWIRTVGKSGDVKVTITGEGIAEPIVLNLEAVKK